MPRKYNAMTDHSPIDYQKDLRAIGRYFREKASQFVAIYDRWKLTAPDHDDLRALLEQITRRLADFALTCDAIPVRTPRKLMATVSEIATRPAEFLADAGRYDPEAVALVYGAFARNSRESRTILLQFDAGIGPPPSAEAIALAASEVMAELEKQRGETPRRGGQTLVLQRELIQDLAAIFMRFGGSSKRITQFKKDLPAQYIYHGPFHDFLALVLVPVRPFARRAGFKMESIRSLAGIPDWENLATSKPDLFEKDGRSGPERGPPRVGNFFKLHSNRLKNRSC